jgi:nicotinamidase-related amidase
MATDFQVPALDLVDRVDLDPHRTALIVVDMQRDFVSEGGALRVPTAHGTIPEIQRLLTLARDAGMRVVFTQDTHGENDPEFRIWPEHAREGSWGWEIIDELAPRPGETVLRKLRYDAFYGTPLDHLLRQWGIRTLVLCGTVANICVHYTAASAALRWYDIIVPHDAVSALDPFDLAASLRQTSFLFAGMVTTVSGLHIAV